MDFGAILAFIFIFVLILAILVGIAYYGMNPTNKYGEAANSEATSGTASDAKLGTKKQRQQKSAANGKVGIEIVHENLLIRLRLKLGYFNNPF